MRNMLLTLSFDGSGFHGWQMQKNAVSVQSVLSDAILKLSGERVTLHGCSRTDAGVHANMFCAGFKTGSDIEPETYVKALNYYLPYSVAVSDCDEKEDAFHARFDCKAKEYVYLIWNAKQRNPFYQGRAYHYPYSLDDKHMDELCRSIVGTHDFTSFCASNTEIKDKTRTVFSAGVTRDKDFVRFSISGDGFLYNMVRILAGTLLDIQAQKLYYTDINSIIQSGKRSNAGFTAPACGLYLNRVDY